MPHQCTNCGRTFPDGSKEMLSGCPDCGGNKFQFAPSAAAASNASGSSDGTAASETPPADAGGGDEVDASADSSSEGVASRAAETVRGWVSADSPTDRSESTATPGPEEPARERDSTDSRPANERPAESRSTDDENEFSEWPDSARRPEDRSTASGENDQSAARRPDDAAAASSGSSSSTRAPAQGSTESNGDATPEGPTGPATEPDPEDPSLSTLADGENSAQADARSAMVPSEELPERSSRSDRQTLEGPREDGVDPDAEQPPDHGRVVSEPSGDRPSIEELRAELNEQFESIKIVRPGQYELNLMELYNRDEYIISLQEDGRYVIDVPDSWRDGDGDE